MTTTLREFQRDFARIRRMAAAGQTVTVRAADGRAYVFKAVDAPVSVGEQVAHLAGSVRTGRRVKSLAGYGRR